MLCPIDKDDLDLAISRAIEYQVDGLVIATSRLTSRAFAQCEKFGVHLSLINATPRVLMPIALVLITDWRANKQPSI